jgi:hypothetical protein
MRIFLLFAGLTLANGFEVIILLSVLILMFSPLFELIDKKLSDLV